MRAPLRPLAALLALFASLSSVGAAPKEGPPPEPATYRTENYRAPVPAKLSGARVVDTGQAFRLWSAKAAIFIDALPRPPRPERLPQNVVWRDQPRFDIPGSMWLPDTGYGELAAPALNYFEDGLKRATGGDKGRALLFYCLADCWMSWNAAKRAMTLGYSNVSWYPEGTDGWAEAEHPLEERQPEPR